MSKSLGRTTRISAAALAGLFLSLAGASGLAQEDREGVKVELGLTGGYHHFANNLELGVADDPTLPSPKPSAAFGLRVGLVLHPLLVIEAEALGMPTKDNQLGKSAFITGERIHLRFNIAPNAAPGLTPFILAGVGASSVLSSSGGGGYNAIKSGDTDANFYAGAGLKYAINNLFHVRLDGRIIAAPNTKNDGFSADWEVTAGVGVTLGGHPPAPPPAPVAALVKDTDRDGIPDDQDKCPREAGPRANGGCPDKDSDGDGIVDRKDKCPDKAGPAERDGCPEEDADKDGIVDSKDKCPNDAEDKDGFEDEDGCPDTDNDKDGVPDNEDKCPNEPETKNGYQDEDGCPDEVPATVKKFTGVIKGINFRRNSADLKATSFPLLKQAVAVFKEYPALRVEISGHTSNEGRREFNMKLSRKRAEAVKDYLVSTGIDEKRIGTVGYGPDKPIADNDTKDGQEKNRRIEFRLLGAKEQILNQPEPEDINPSPERKHPKKGAKGAAAEKPAAGAAAKKPAGKKKGGSDDEPMPK